MALELGFATNLLDRAGVEREPDPSAGPLEPGTRFVVIAGENAHLVATPDGASAFTPPENVPAGAIAERIVLGRLHGASVQAVLLDAAKAEEIAADPAVLAVDLRTVAMKRTVPAGEIGMLAQAKSLLHWHRRHGFCAQCGTATVPSQAGLRRDCPNCGAQHFPRTDPVTIMLIADGESCLLGRQARFVAGSYSCLAGFVSPGETIEDAVRREVKEEAGIRVGRVRYMFSQPWPFPSSLMIGCLGQAEDREITIDREELEDCRWFSRDEVAAMLERRHPDGIITPPPMAIAHHLMRAWVDGATAMG